MTPEEAIFRVEAHIRAQASRFIENIKHALALRSQQDDSEVSFSLRFDFGDHGRRIVTIVRDYFEAKNWCIQISLVDGSSPERSCEFKFKPKFELPPSLCKMISEEAICRGGTSRDVYLIERSADDQQHELVKYHFNQGAWEGKKAIAYGTPEVLEESIRTLRNVKKLEFKQDSRVPKVLAAWFETYHGE